MKIAQPIKHRKMWQTEKAWISCERGLEFQSFVLELSKCLPAKSQAKGHQTYYGTANTLEIKIRG